MYPINGILFAHSQAGTDIIIHIFTVAKFWNNFGLSILDMVNVITLYGEKLMDYL